MMELERLRVAGYDAGVGRTIIETEKIELDKLLRDDNPVVRAGAQKEYKRYERYLDRITGNKIKKKEKER